MRKTDAVMESGYINIRDLTPFRLFTGQ